MKTVATDKQVQVVVRAALLALFPGIPERDADGILTVAFAVGSGQTCHTSAIDLVETLELAVLTHLGHASTSDHQLVVGRPRPDVSEVYERLQRTDGPLKVPRPPIPEWRRGPGKLWFRGHLIKCFSKPADNQKTVLDVFQRHNWPHEIFNPFRASASPLVAGDTAKRTAENLNDDHATPKLLWFGTRQKGDYIYWSTTEDS